MVNLETLLTSFTTEEALSLVLDLMQSQGFDTTGWQEGRIAKTMVTTYATILAEMSEVHAITASMGANDYAEGVALDMYSRSRYNNTAVPARATQGRMPLTSVSATPYELKAGGLLVGTDTGVQFRLDEDVTIPAGTIAVPAVVSPGPLFTCTVQGSIGNVNSGAVKRVLAPSLAGVSVNNVGAPWYVVSGRDVEEDESLRQRNRSKWPTLSVEPIAEAYENIAREAGAVKVKVDDQNPRGAGTIDVYVAGNSSLLTPTEMGVIQQAMSLKAFQTDNFYPASSDSRANIVPPPTTSFGVEAFLFHRADVASTVIQARAREALLALLARCPIGGFDYAPGPEHIILVDDIREALRHVAGVKSVSMTAPSADIVIPPNYLVVEGIWLFYATPLTG